MGKYPNKTKDGKDLLAESYVLDFCEPLDERGRLTLAMCIDEEVTGMGLASTRAGSEAWEYARRCAVTELIARELDIAELADDHLETLGQTDSTQDEVKAAAKAHKKRIESFAEYLHEEAKEKIAERCALVEA